VRERERPPPALFESFLLLLLASQLESSRSSCAAPPHTHAGSRLLRRRYADEFDLAVVATNQITDSLGERGRSAAAAGHTGGLRLASSGREVVPALGLAWANCVNTRVFLSRAVLPDGSTPLRHAGPPGEAAQRAAREGRAGSGGGAAQAAPQLRTMRLVFCPFLPQSECAYVVESTGVRGLHPDEQHQR
jgi:DNA-repair protein XRCC3